MSSAISPFVDLGAAAQRVSKAFPLAVPPPPCTFPQQVAGLRSSTSTRSCTDLSAASNFVSTPPCPLCVRSPSISRWYRPCWWKAPEKAKTTAAPLPHCSKFVTVSQYSITCNTAMHNLPTVHEVHHVQAASSMQGGKRREKQDASGDSGSAGGQARSERVNAVTPIYHAPALQESYLGSLYSLLPIFSDCSREQFFCFFPLIFILFLLLYRFINTINK